MICLCKGTSESGVRGFTPLWNHKISEHLNIKLHGSVFSNGKMSHSFYIFIYYCIILFILLFIIYSAFSM